MTVDGKSVGSVSEYAYDVTGDGKIEVTFKKRASQSTNGSSVVIVGTTDNTDKNNDKEEINETAQTEIAEWINPFGDVAQGEWYYEYVKYVNTKGLMNGISKTEFAPNNTVTRAMFVTVLYRLEKEPKAGKSGFSDVPVGAYYENAVGWAVEKGIVNGVSKTEFAPEATITREQMATMVYRYMKFKGLDMSVDKKSDITSYDDFESISDYATDAFRYACSRGIISGTSPTTLSPGDSATRAQMAAIFQRCENVILNQ